MIKQHLVVCAWLTSAWLGGCSSGSLPENRGSAPSEINVYDQAALQRGAKLFFAYCIGCHSLKYERYSRITEDLGLSEQEVMQHFNVTGAGFDDPMLASMPVKVAQRAFGKVPPDLSLEVRARGSDWVYAYLNGFYRDPTQPTGWNNRVFPGVAMPNPFWQLQGIQTALRSPADNTIVRLELTHGGMMNTPQFHALTRDLTAFLDYVSEPAALQRHHYGVWVLLFLCVFTLLAYMLKREYWKDLR